MSSNAASLARLMAWLSPVFPTGGFAYSAGLESAAREGRVATEPDLHIWLETLLTRGTLWNEAVLLAAAHRNEESTERLCDLAAALSPSAERYRETRDQGAAFLDAASAWQDIDLPPTSPLPIALGILCNQTNISVHDTLVAMLQTLISNQLQAAIRLSLIGQTGAARLLAALEPAILATADRAANTSLDDLGSSAFLADILSVRHETLEPRIFLS